MYITVVIAVYNGASFIKRAIDSCTHFTCVKEIVIVDDGSTDDSFKVAKKIASTNNKIIVLQHSDAQNKGAGASWNLGIKKATNKYIAILGVDDVFHKNRFDVELELYNSNKAFDGVYGAMDAFYISDFQKEKFLKIFHSDITTIQKPINAKELKYLLLQMYKDNKGYFSLNSLTVKKSLLLKVGSFNTKLRLHQDTDLIVKLSCIGNLVAGNIEKPISSRGVHENNRITSNASNFSSRYLMYKEMLDWIQRNVKDEKIIQKLNADLSCYSFLSKRKKFNIFEALFLTFSNGILFFNDKYFNLIINNASTSIKNKDIIIRAKEKIVLLFLKKIKKKYSIYINE